MKKPLIALALALLTLPFGCKVEKDEPDPLASRTGFCSAWAANACNAKVVENCNAQSVEDCKAAQSDFCLGVIPEAYTSKHATACLDAVKTAYADASLSSAELAIVLKLGDPCDKLSKGTSVDGESCTENADCNTAGGLTCVIKLGAASGTCHTPEEVGGGERCKGDAQVCADGFYCNGVNCVASAESGEDCQGDYECTPENHCVTPTDATTGTCEARLALNDSCTADAECASGYCAIAPKDTMGGCASTIVLSRLEPLCLNLR
ncbi:MAG TPA: hypothetical protein VNG33_07355 [Polyangiaceae bacterium]|nr:hypothetical protein [Polyangiaceae bacterium]